MPTFSYSGDPGASRLDALRFILGDTDENRAVFSDEELDWISTQQPNIWHAAALAADTAWSSFASGQSSTGSASNAVKTRTVGALSLTYSIMEDKDRAEQFKEMAINFRRRAALGGGWSPYAGGISKSDKETREQDTDWDRPAFARGMFDNPGGDVKPREMTRDGVWE